MTRRRDTRDLHFIPNPIYGFEPAEGAGKGGGGSLALQGAPAVSAEMRQLLRSGNIGFMGVLPVSQTFATPASLISVIGPDNESHVVTVTLAGPPPTQRSSLRKGGLANAVAYIVWGCGGMVSYAEVDWNQTLSLSASRLNVGGYIDRYGPNLGPDIETDARRAHGAFVSYGNHSRQAPLYRTIQLVGPTGAGAVSTVGVPPFATRVSFLSLSSPLTDPQIGFHLIYRNYNGDPIATDRWPVGGGPLQPLIVPNGACEIECTNDGLEIAEDGWAVFELAL